MQRGLFDEKLIEETNDAIGKITLNKTNIKDLLDQVDSIDEDESDIEKILKSNKISIGQRLALITKNVYRVLGKYRKNVVVIKTKQQFDEYINAAIKSGRIAIDTETNNSLDPVTCKLAGLCLYYPSGMQAYIPVNHRDPYTKERLAWQLTEQDCKEELQRIIDSKIFKIMHNGKFDYEVIKETCDIEVAPDADTMIEQRVTDENDLSGLKYLYTKYINPAQAKYDIEKLFVNISYLDVDPDVFALYAATDSFDTDEVWLWKLKEFFNISNKDIYREGGIPSEDLILADKLRLYKLNKDVETPIAKITGDMELTGVKIDQELGARLKDKYSAQLTKLDEDINKQLELISDKILNWRLTPEANSYPKQFQPKKSKKSRAELEKDYPLIDNKTGKRYRISKKCLKDQLEDPINLASPAQLAILFYDIFEIEPFDKKTPRATGEEAIETIKDIFENKSIEASTWQGEVKPTAADYAYLDEQAKPYKAMMELCDLLLQRRGLVKILTTYIETIPTLVKHWPDGRIRFHLNSLGTDTGRFSSGGKLKFMENDEPIEVSGINVQNIPSHVKEIRLLFSADYKEDNKEINNNTVVVKEYEELETVDGWKYPVDLKINDSIITDEGTEVIKNIIYNSQEKSYLITL